MPYNPDLSEASSTVYDLEEQIEILKKISNANANGIMLSEKEKLTLLNLLIQLKRDLQRAKRNEVRLKFRAERENKDGVRY